MRKYLLKAGEVNEFSVKDFKAPKTRRKKIEDLQIGPGAKSSWIISLTTLMWPTGGSQNLLEQSQHHTPWAIKKFFFIFNEDIVDSHCGVF